MSSIARVRRFAYLKKAVSDPEDGLVRYHVTDLWPAKPADQPLVWNDTMHNGPPKKTLCQISSSFDLYPARIPRIVL